MRTSETTWWRRFELGRFLEAALVRRVPRDHRQSDRAFLYRRVVAGVTLLVGATLLAVSLRIPPGDNRFYLATAALALTWTLGAFASGPLHLGWANTRDGMRHERPFVQPVVLGLLAVGIFSAGAVLVAQVPLLRDQVDSVLDHARFSSLGIVALITLVNGLAEELFFRGAVYAAIGLRYPVTISTALYAAATAATGNVMLVFAAVVLGLLTGLQRRVTGGVLAPMLTHITWSLGMLLILPPLLGALG